MISYYYPKGIELICVFGLEMYESRTAEGRMKSSYRLFLGESLSRAPAACMVEPSVPARVRIRRPRPVARRVVSQSRDPPVAEQRRRTLVGPQDVSRVYCAGPVGECLIRRATVRDDLTAGVVDPLVRVTWPGVGDVCIGISI